VLEGAIAVRAAVHARSREIHRVVVSREKRDRRIEQLVERARAAGVPVERATPDAVDALAGGKTHGGVVAVAGERRFVGLSDLVTGTATPFVAMLDGIEDPYNFGYAVRALYAAGVDGLVLRPRNWTSAAGVVGRASAGASELVRIALAADPLAAAQTCAELGLTVACAAGERDAVSVYDADLRGPLFLVIGGEKRGVARELLRTADLVVRIPYARDFRQSLGTSAAAAVLAFEARRQRLENRAPRSIPPRQPGGLAVASPRRTKEDE
jgi:23S rRNA (guanosine2251-2'-O)-methyltransferase